MESTDLFRYNPASARNNNERVCMLTIAGLDPSGGAGIAADLRAAHATGVWGCAVCAVITVQSTAGLVSAVPVDSNLVRSQSHEVLAHERIAAIKIGALGSAENVETVEAIVRSFKGICVVDPVMIATRADNGATLLDPRALAAMRKLVGVATLVTPNVDEAEALLDTKIVNEADLVEASRSLVRMGAKAALVKGGHLDGPEAVDILAFGNKVVRLAGPRLPVPEFHGGGCSLASLIAAKMASELPTHPTDSSIEKASVWAKQQLAASIANAQQIGDGLRVLDLLRVTLSA